MLAAKVYDVIKADVEYIQNTVIRYVKAKSLIEEYEGILRLEGKGRVAGYYRCK